MKVAAILDHYTVAISTYDTPPEIGQILGVGIGRQIIDPDTGELLGELPIVKLKVTDVYPLFCVAETYRFEKPSKNVVNVGDKVYPLWV